MRLTFRLLAPLTAGLLLTVCGASKLNAQITNAIRTHITHSFVVDNTTLPPGEYTFRMIQGTDNTAMIVSNPSGTTRVEFLVRQSNDRQTPKHSELVFRKCGNMEFLSKIYESGSQIGVSTTETSREEARMVKQGEHETEHAEAVM